MAKKYEWVELNVLLRKEYIWKNSNILSSIKELKNILKSENCKLEFFTLNGDDIIFSTWKDLKYFWEEANEIFICTEESDILGNIDKRLFKLRSIKNNDIK